MKVFEDHIAEIRYRVDAWKVMRRGKSARHDDPQPMPPLAARSLQRDQRNRRCRSAQASDVSDICRAERQERPAQPVQNLQEFGQGGRPIRAPRNAMTAEL